MEAGRKAVRAEVEYRLKRGDGAWIHVRQVIEPLQSQAGAEGGKRWFSTLQDVTEQKQAQEALAESEFRFRQLTENITEAFWLTDPFKGGMLYISPAYERIWGRSCQALYASPRDWVEAIHPEDRQRVLDAAIAKQARGDYDEEYRIVRPDGSMRWIRDRAFPVSDSEGRVYRIAGVAEDITERKRAADKIRRLNRVYAVLSGINTLIVRARDRDELFRESCTIAVEAGQFPVVWIGLADRETGRVKPVAWGGGAEQFLASAPLSMSANRAAGRGMSGTAISEKKAMIANDIQNDPRTQMKEQSKERGINSLAFLPLIVGDEGIGVLGLYASETGFFDDEEMKLLLELAGDISFALDHLEKEEKLNYLAYYDALTGLANATLFRERVDHYVHDAGPTRRKLAVMLIDVDRFKTINDTLGRHAGDEILKGAVRRMLQYGDPGHLARINADRFAMVMPGVNTEQDVARRVEEQLR